MLIANKILFNKYGLKFSLETAAKEVTYAQTLHMVLV